MGEVVHPLEVISPGIEFFTRINRGAFSSILRSNCGSRLKTMKVVVPAAGEGSRLGALTAERPKGLVRVGGEPLLAHVFRTAVNAGATTILAVVGENGDAVRRRFGTEFRSIPVQYVEQPQPLGLGDAVLRARDRITDTFVVLNGDNVFFDPITPALERADRTDVDGVLLVEETTMENARTTGVVECDGSTVVDIAEKPDVPSSTVVTTGCVVLPPAIFPALELARPSERGELELATGIDLLIAAGYAIDAVCYRGRRINVNRPEDIEAAEQLFGREK